MTISILALCMAALVFGFFVFATYTIRLRGSDNPQAEGMVALTGGPQRIKVAGRLLKEKLARRLLISGVNRIVNHDKLRRLLDIDEVLFECCVDVDYAAQNTRGNAAETRKWVLKHDFDSLIVVTSVYHMPRSLTELGFVLPAVDLIAHPVVPRRPEDGPWWLDRHSLIVLGAEYLKYLPSAAQYSFGRLVDSPQPSVRRALDHRAVAVQ